MTAQNSEKADLDLMNIHIRALFTQDAQSRLLFVNEPGGTTIPAPRLFLGRTRAGSVWRFRADLPESLCAELNALCADEPPPPEADFRQPPRHLEKFLQLLDATERETSNGLAYQFTEFAVPSPSVLAVTENSAEILKGGFEDFVSELPTWQPFFALVVENRAVSVCRSVRITSAAHEAGVETLPDFRGRGYAKEVTAQWARTVRDAKAIPLYSTAWENTASQAVTRKLNLKCYGTDFQIS